MELVASDYDVAIQGLLRDLPQPSVIHFDGGAYAFLIGGSSFSFPVSSWRSFVRNVTDLKQEREREIEREVTKAK